MAGPLKEKIQIVFILQKSKIGLQMSYSVRVYNCSLSDSV